MLAGRMYLFIFCFLALGLFCLGAKTVSILRAPSRAGLTDFGDLLTYFFLAGFPAACGLMVYAGPRNQSLVPGLAVLGGAVFFLVVGLILRSKGGAAMGGDYSSDPGTVANLRMRVIEKVGGAIGQDLKAEMAAAAASAPNARRGRGVRWFGFSTFALIGLAVLVLGSIQVLHALQSKSWPQTDGTITFSDIEAHRHTGRHSHTTWGVNVEYDYAVAGVHHQGTRLAFGMVESSMEHAQSYVNRYPAGRHVPVFYSQSDPETAVLEPGIHGGSWVALGVGGVFAVVGLGGLFVMWKFPLGPL